MNTPNNSAGACIDKPGALALTVRGTTIYAKVRIPVPMWIPAYLPKGPQ